MHSTRTNPQCPICHGPITFVHGLLSIWNPWRVRCPGCGVLLQMSLLQKILFLLALPFGVIYGGVLICIEESVGWGTMGTLVFFVSTALILIGIDFLLWPKTKIYPKNKKR